MRRTRSAVGFSLRPNSGDYNGVGQNTVAFSEILLLLFFIFFCIAGLSAKIRRTNSQRSLFCTHKDEQQKSAILYK